MTMQLMVTVAGCAGRRIGQEGRQIVVAATLGCWMLEQRQF